MTNKGRRHTRGRAISLAIVLAAALAPVVVAQAPEPPTPPPPPPPPPSVASDGIKFRIAPEETHRGDVYRMTTTTSIEGTLDGDLWCWASAIRIPGTVKGDVNAFAGTVDISGVAEDSVRAYAGDIRIAGRLGSELFVSGGVVTIAKDAVIAGPAKIFAKEVVLEGTIEDDLVVTGGIARLSGTVRGDADITVDEIEIDPATRIEGDLRYYARKPLNLEGTGIVGGDILYNEASEKRIEIEHSRRESRGFAFRFVLFLAALLFGTIALALFRPFVPVVTRAVGEPAQCLGAGFLATLSPIAVFLTVILVITIPLIVLYWLLFAVAVYLAKVPVAVWLGNKILDRIRGRASSVYLAFLVGLLALFILFAIPVIGKILWIAVAWLGLGAMVIGVRNWRQTRRAATATPPAAPPAPAPTVEPAS